MTTPLSLPLATGKELMHDTVFFMRLHPQKWHQGNWAKRTACGTTMCFAGNIVSVAGFNMHFSEHPTTSRIKETYDGESDIFGVAWKLLKVEFDQAWDLFYATRFCIDHDRVVTGDDDDCDDNDHDWRDPQLEEYITHIERITGLDFSNDKPGLRGNPFLMSEPNASETPE